MKVYVVTSGRYSDYRIEAIFKKKSDAVTLASVLSDGNEVEEWTVNTRRIIPLWSIWMKKSGDLDEDYGSPTADIEEMGETEGIYTSEYEETGHFVILADTMKRAIKIANERRTIILANNLWGDDEKINELFTNLKDGER
jgi:hypothetical protein